MNTFFSIIFVVFGIILGVGIFYIFGKKQSGPTNDNQALGLLQNQLNESFRIFQQQMKEIRSEFQQSNQSMQQQVQYQFGESAKIIKDITQELVKVGEGQKQVMSITDQLKSLQDILKNPKQRGVLGEYYLKTLLENVMPPGSFQMQYAFTDGTIVDAAVFVKDKVIPIDSKFSLENYNRIIQEHDAAEREKFEKLFKQDLKLRIDETSKYVKPEEGTMDFAFMFIPAEAIYYDLLINQVGAVKSNTRDLIEYAFSQKVIIVSPTSFLAYLQTVLQGLRALKIEESAKEIRKNVEQLGRHIQAYEEHFIKVGKNIGATVNSYSFAQKELKKIDKDVLRITGESIGIAEPLAIEKPEEVI